MNYYKTLALLSISLFTISCSNDSESDLADNDPITEPITYTADVKSIIDNNCLSCHGNPTSSGAPMSLDTYEKVKEAVLNRGLTDRISRADGSIGAMPLGGPRLSQNQINKIISWASNGQPE
ncbi:MAG: cytochrome c [Bacteroidota bacterium]